jgi:hypothetical protein
MIVRPLSRHRDVLLLLVILAFALSTLSCCLTGAARTAGGRGAVALNKATLKCDVQIVAVLTDGTTIPETVKLRRGVQIVIWAADADKLEVEFPGGANPFGQPVPCQGRFCGTLVTPNGAPGSYKYTVKVTTNGVVQQKDPHAEIWE